MDTQERISEPKEGGMPLSVPTIEEAKKLAAGPYAEQLLLVLFAYAVPLSWA